MSAGALTAEPPGWYGKLSVLGDFAHRRLAPEVVQRLDPWLAAWVAESRQAWGERWLAAYLSAPLLRFAWSPQVVGPRWWFGVLMPSCDRAGRYFPLLVAQPRAAPPADAAALDRLGHWLDRLADAATGTLDDTATVDAFEAALAAAAEAEADATGATPGMPPSPAGCFGGPGTSHWWVGRLGAADTPMTCLPGLPDAASVTRLLFAPDPPPPD